MGFGNIFDDPEVKRQILEEQGIKPIEDSDGYEIIENDEDLSSFQGIIDSAPKIPGGGIIKNIIKDASAIVKDDKKAKEIEMNNTISDMFSQYNKEYGLDLQVDPNNLTRTLIDCADDRKQKILTLYVSKCVRGLRPILLLKMISSLSLAIQTLTSPEYLLNRNELSYTDLFIAVDSIWNYLGKLEDLKNEIMIDNEDLELKKIAEESGMEYQEQDEEMVRNFMELFKKDKLEGKS